MGNFSFKNFGFTPFMNEMRAILKPELPYLYSKLLEACALFGCSHISGYIKLSLVWGKKLASGTLDLRFQISVQNHVPGINFLDYKQFWW